MDIIRNHSNISEESIQDGYLDQEETQLKEDQLFFRNLEMKRKNTLTLQEIDEIIEKYQMDKGVKYRKWDYNKIFVVTAYEYYYGTYRKISDYLKISASRVSNINSEYEQGKFEEEIVNAIHQIRKEIADNFKLRFNK